MEWWHEIEKYYEYFNANRENGKPPYRFNRKNLSVDDLITLSYSYFEPAIDERNDFGNPYKQLELFSHELDISNGCIESCEPFI